MFIEVPLFQEASPPWKIPGCSSDSDQDSLFWNPDLEFIIRKIVPYLSEKPQYLSSISCL